MQTASGRKFWPIDPRPEDVFIDDIAASLSKQCRFAGHCLRFYSVAQHCCIVHDLAISRDAKRLALAALLHDAAEAYAVDVPRPLKPFLAGYADIERALERCIETAFGLTPGVLRSDAIKYFDNVALATERRDVMGPSPHEWTTLPPPIDERITCWEPDMARDEFMRRWFR